MQVKVSWRGEWNEGKQQLQTTGALVLAGDEIIYVPQVQEFNATQPNLDDIQSDIDYAVTNGFKSEEIFKYYIDSIGNMITESYSQPESMQGKTLDDIIERISDRLNNIGG